MSTLLFGEPIRGAVTKLDINGKGRNVTLDPGVPLRIKGAFKAQNPRSDPTDTVQLILFLDDDFFKCIYNDVPAAEPSFTEEAFITSCHAPEKAGKYILRAGWAYNWNWPNQAYDYLRLVDPGRLQTVGSITVGKLEVVTSLLPAVIFAIPIGTIIGLAAYRK